MLSRRRDFGSKVKDTGRLVWGDKEGMKSVSGSVEQLLVSHSIPRKRMKAWLSWCENLLFHIMSWKPCGYIFSIP